MKLLERNETRLIVVSTQINLNYHQNHPECEIESTVKYIITHLAGQMYVWHGCKWNFAGPQIHLQPAKTKSQYFGVSLKFLVCN